MTKICSICRHNKNLDYFWKNKSQKDGRDNLCTECRNSASMKYKRSNRERISDIEAKYKTTSTYLAKRCSKYGITITQYENMKKNQADSCKICLNKVDLVIDHCHKTGKVRGLLCNRCNLKLGIIDDKEWLQKAKAYLEDIMD